MTDIILITCAIVFAITGFTLQWRIALLTARAKYAPLVEERAREREQVQRDIDDLLAEHKAKMRDWERLVAAEKREQDDELGLGVKPGRAEDDGEPFDVSHMVRGDYGEYLQRVDDFLADAIKEQTDDN